MLRTDTDGSYEYAIGGNVRDDASICVVQGDLGHIRVFPSSEIIARSECSCTKLAISRSIGGVLVKSDGENEFLVANLASGMPQ